MCAYCNTLESSSAGSHEIKATITLGSGNTIKAMLSSADTQIPEGIQLYSGDDINYIPHSLHGTANDLVIYVADGLLLSGLAVSYFDPVSAVWVGPIAPQLFLTNGSLNWGSWRNFAQVAVPFKSRITLLGAFIEPPKDEDEEESRPGDGNVDNVDDKLDPTSDNAVSNKAVTGALSNISEDVSEVSEKLDTVIDALKTGGVGYSVISIDPTGK